ncbi:GRB2-associated and regulator of MAPK protein-like, partial [Scleropages formosus]
MDDVTWSATTVPLDRLVSVYRLPQIVRLDCGELVEGLQENDYVLIHSSRQWTTVTAHSLEEGHYVIGPKIEIPVHYEGQFKLLEQDRDIKEPVQYFSSVEEVAKAFPERVYVMEDITFNVKVASGECNEDTEVYNITLSTGDELTLMGQAEILYAKTSKEKSRLNTIFKKIGKLNSLSKLGRGKMPCLICMNHRTNESISLPFQCKGRFSTRSPLELQMQEGEHTIRNIVERTRLPVNVTVPSTPPRNQYDLHLIREGHRYKLVNIQTKTVVVCCVLRSNKIIPIHFPLHLAVPKFIIPEGLLQNELWLDTMVHRWFSFCQEQFDIDDYSRAVRNVRTDWTEDGKSPKKNGSKNGSSSSNCQAQTNVPSSLTYARDELTQSFHRLSVCVYGSNLHGNSEVNLQGFKNLYEDWTLVPHDSLHSDSVDSNYLFPELVEDSGPPVLIKSDLPYEELWLDQSVSQQPAQSASIRKNVICDSSWGCLNSKCCPVASAPYPASGSVAVSEIHLPPPPLPPKSEAVKEECRLLNAPPIPPRCSRTTTTNHSVSHLTTKHQQQQTRCPSPTLSYYSSGLHSIGLSEKGFEQSDEQNTVCSPCSWMKPVTPEDDKMSAFGSHSSEAVLFRLSWPNNFTEKDFQKDNATSPVLCQSYYSYPRQKTSNTPKGFTSASFDADGKVTDRRILPSRSCEASYAPPYSCSLEMYSGKTIASCSTKQSSSCPILPPRVPKSVEQKKDVDFPSLTGTSNEVEHGAQNYLMDKEDNHAFATKGMKDDISVSHCFYSPLQYQNDQQSCSSQWKPPNNLSGLSIEEVSNCLSFIGLPEDIVSLFVREKVDGSLLVQLTEDILSEDFKLSNLQ